MLWCGGFKFFFFFKVYYFSIDEKFIIYWYMVESIFKSFFEERFCFFIELFFIFNVNVFRIGKVV